MIMGLELPKASFMIHMNLVHQDTHQLINYVQAEVCSTDRGTFDYDGDAGRFVLSLDTIPEDLDYCAHLRHQKAKKVWLVFRGTP